MDMDIVEIECPVCDRKVRADAPRCPYCGAEFAMSGVDELERVAREINGNPTPEDLAGRTKAAASVATASDDNANKDAKEDKGFFGKLFRKRR